MRGVIFAGPSMPPSCRSDLPGLEWRAPVQQGDLYNEALSWPAIIGVIDGYFETVPTVWHKEILWAMSRGIHVYGAASIGALRAAELCEFGMEGVGKIFESYRDGVLEDDDEVAILHGPAELDYLPLTEPLVNIRATLDAAVAQNIVDIHLADALLAAAKSLFYKERTWDAVLKAAPAGDADQLARITSWLPAGTVDMKRQDAVSLTQAVVDNLIRGVMPLKTTYALSHTAAFESTRRLVEEETQAAPRRKNNS